MVITDKFVYIHMPKTGGTFASEMLQRAYGLAASAAPWGRLYRKLSLRKKWIWINKHGTCAQIPDEYASLPVVGCVRNPFDRYVSQYEFKWWLTYPEQFPLLQEHPSYPGLSFEEFVRFANEKWLDRENPGLQVNRDLGWQTVQFVSWYCQNPLELLDTASGPSLTTHDVRASIRPERFLRTGRLNQDLYDYLRDKGFQESKISFILASPRILPEGRGRGESGTWHDYYTPALKRFVRERERMLLELFPEFDL